MNDTETLDETRKFVIVGGGPAGLTAGHELLKYGVEPVVLEKLDKVGGIARTENYKGYYFDMGGHRFFSKSQEVNKFWDNVLGEDFLRRPRLSRIYYNRKFFNYPLKPFNALAGLGIWQSIMVASSYLRWQIFPHRKEETFEEWVTNRFGYRLFSIFFKSYTEKVWGISTSELKAEWAAQRIKDLSLKTTILNMLIKRNNTITTLIEEFKYPRRGPGMLWMKVQDAIDEAGGSVQLNTEVVGVNRDGNRIISVEACVDGELKLFEGTDFISTMPIPVFIKSLKPPPPAEVLSAASNLRFRDFLTVCLIIDKEEIFPDNWIYVHYPHVKVGRIQNFKNWSPEMVPDQSKSSLGLEYFCNQGDELWCMPDEELIELGKREMAELGIIDESDVFDGCVFRVENTYPVYDAEYRTYLDTLRSYLETLENFQTIGRNGLHRYNNQDHAMLTGMLAVRNMMLGESNDLWVVNAEQEYHEELVEGKADEKPLEEIFDAEFSTVFPKLDAGAFGVAFGMVLGLVLALLTFVLSFNEAGPVAEKFWLLGQYFPGYRVTGVGSLLGLVYGFLSGFVMGWWFAFMRNLLVLLYMAIVYRRAQVQLMRKVLDF